MTSTVRPNEGLLLLISDAVVIAFVAATQCALFCGAGSCAPCTSISLAQTVCFVFDYSALRTSLVTLTAMVEAIEGSDATAEELSGQMERIWELGNEVVVPAFDRSLEAYRADGEHRILWLILIWLVEMLCFYVTDRLLIMISTCVQWTAADYSDGLQSVLLFLQLGVFGLLTLVLGLR